MIGITQILAIVLKASSDKQGIIEVLNKANPGLVAFQDDATLFLLNTTDNLLTRDGVELVLSSFGVPLGRWKLFNA